KHLDILELTSPSILEFTKLKRGKEPKMSVRLLIAALFSATKPKITVQLVIAMLFSVLSFLLLQVEKKEVVYQQESRDSLSIHYEISLDYSQRPRHPQPADDEKPNVIQ